MTFDSSVVTFLPLECDLTHFMTLSLSTSQGSEFFILLGEHILICDLGDSELMYFIPFIISFSILLLTCYFAGRICS